MSSNNIQNQVHPPRPKRREVDLNVRKRIYCKCGNSSMLLAKGVTIPSAKIFISSIRENAKRLGINLELNMIITQ